MVGQKVVSLWGMKESSGRPGRGAKGSDAPDVKSREGGSRLPLPPLSASLPARPQAKMELIITIDSVRL